MRNGLLRVIVVKNDSGGFTVTSEHLESGRKLSTSDRVFTKVELKEARDQHEAFIAKKNAK